MSPVNGFYITVYLLSVRIFLMYKNTNIDKTTVANIDKHIAKKDPMVSWTLVWGTMDLVERAANISLGFTGVP